MPGGSGTGCGTGGRTRRRARGPRGGGESGRAGPPLSPPPDGRSPDLAPRLQGRGHRGQGRGQGRRRPGRFVEGDGGPGGVDGRAGRGLRGHDRWGGGRLRQFRRPPLGHRQLVGRGQLGQLHLVEGEHELGHQPPALLRLGRRLLRCLFGPVALDADLGQTPLQPGHVVGRRPPGLALVGQRRHRPGRLGLGCRRRFLRPPPGRLRPRQPLAGVALCPSLPGGRPRVLGVGHEGRQLVLPACGPGQVDPPRTADVALGDRVEDPDPELVVGVEHPPGGHQGRPGQLGEVQERPQGGGRRLDRGGLLARPSHRQRRLQCGTQQSVAGRAQAAHPRGDQARDGTRGTRGTGTRVT